MPDFSGHKLQPKEREREREKERKGFNFVSYSPHTFQSYEQIPFSCENNGLDPAGERSHSLVPFTRSIWCNK